MANDDDNEFDPAKLRLSQNFGGDGGDGGVKKLITSVPARKPGNHDWIRVHPDPGYRLEIGALELKDNQQEIYLIAPSLHVDLGKEISPRALLTTMTRQGVLFLWPLKLPQIDGRTNLWNESAAIAAKLAEENWIRMTSNMALGAYESYVATAEIPEPEWPDLTFEQILKIAFRDRFINSMDHIVLRRLRGEI